MNYPTWICDACGQRLGRGWPNGHVATFHFGRCDVCGREDRVTQPRDYGHLKDGWEQEIEP